MGSHFGFYVRARKVTLSYDQLLACVPTFLLPPDTGSFEASGSKLKVRSVRVYDCLGACRSSES